MRIFPAILMVIILFCLLVSGQTNRNLDRDKSDKVETRIALVIGNGSYQKVAPLDNPVNDAKDMAAALAGLGFDVIKGTDANLVQMRRLIRQFGEKLKEQKGVGLFYYAGHGVEVRGKNFLVPVDADIASEVETEDYAIDVNSILRQMDAADNGFNIVILDACRNNPFSRGWNRSVDSGGLAQTSAPTGTYIAFAAAPGSTAADGKGSRNGIFTGVLLKNLRRPDLKLEEVFKATREEVMTITGRKQVPWDSSSIQGDFCFSVSTAAGNSAKPGSAKEEIVTTKNNITIEREAWSLVRASTDPQDFRNFLNEFPAGANAANAKIKLEQAVWDSMSGGRDKSRIQAYLSEFPAGINAPLARIRLRQLDTAAAETAITSPGNGPGTVAAGTIRKNSNGMEFVYIPPGEFLIGSENGEADEKPVHRVTISRGFWMGKYEVTQTQYEQAKGTNPSYFKGCGNCPVEMVSWYDAMDFISRLNAKNDGLIYSLPTEAEWEYAAGAGTTLDYAESLNEIAWYGDNSGMTTHPVGSKHRNAWGLYDMKGNVWEWCHDWYNEKYYSDAPANDPTGPSNGAYRVLRGGSFNYVESGTRSADRYWDILVRGYNLGFRVLARPR